MNIRQARQSLGLGKTLFVLVAIVAIAATVEFGTKPINMIRLVTIITLVVTGLIKFFGHPVIRLDVGS